MNFHMYKGAKKKMFHALNYLPTVVIRTRELSGIEGYYSKDLTTLQQDYIRGGGGGGGMSKRCW